MLKVFNNLIIIISIVLTFLSCTKEKNINLGKIKIEEEIVLNEPIIPSTLMKTKNNFLAYNAHSRELIIFNESGKILDRYNNEGKGPGEYLPSQDLFIIGEYNNKYYVGANAQNKIMIFNLINDNKIVFYDEIRINDGNIAVAGISNNGYLYINFLSGKYLFQIYDSDGTLIKKILKKENIDMDQLDAKELKKYIISNIYIPHFTKNKMIIIGAYNKNVKFYEAKNHNFELIKSIKIKDFKEKSYKSKTNQNKKERKVYIANVGLVGANILNNKLFVGVSPKYQITSYIHSYNLSGKYIGSYLIENEINEKIAGLFQFATSKFLITKKRREDKNSKFKFERSKIYFGNLVKE